MCLLQTGVPRQFDLLYEQVAEGATVIEMAERHGKTEETMKRKLNRARTAVREFLAVAQAA
jgi:DNA-directed RNA polymerase specialized sigma24 family protein